MIASSRSGSVSPIGAPGHEHAQEPVAHLELVDRDALLAREALGALSCRCSGGPGPTRPASAREVVDEKREPARCDEDRRGLAPSSLRASPGSWASASAARAGSSSQPISNSSAGKALHVLLGDGARASFRTRAM